MFGFWLIAALLLLISLFVILLTLLKTYDDDDVIEEDSSDLYQQHLAEIEQDIENGILGGTEAKKIKEELQLSFLNQTNNKTEHPLKTKSGSSTSTAIILLLLTPVFAIAMYQYLGQPQLIKEAELLTEFHNASTKEEKLASIDKMLTQLEQRMINNPDDIDGWLMLTNSYTALERYPDALRAVNNLYRLRSEDPTVMLRYAEILSMTNDGVFAGRPTELINEALRLDPENPNGLWFAGLAANERGEIDKAVEYWQQLIPKFEDGSEQQQQVKKFIQIISPQTVVEENETPSSKDKPEYKIQVNVSLSDELIHEARSDDTVFIYAQAISGPPMPIAVVRKKVSDLPLLATLNDSMAMMPSNKLSDHAQVKLTARISKSGNAIPEPGDLIGSINSVETSLNEPVNISISQKVP